MNLIPVLKPTLPSVDSIISSLREVDQKNWYTNLGPKERTLRETLSTTFQRESIGEIALFSSGTSALIACMKSWDLPPGSKCLVPSWTFVGSACAIVQAGLIPVFVDVDAKTWAPSRQSLDQHTHDDDVRAALIVSPFGGEVDYPELCRVADESGLKILIDAAASFDFVCKLCSTHQRLSIPIMISLHATKLVSSIEGGLILCGDIEQTQRMIAWSNFGIFDTEPISQIGTNAKLSEVHAVYGLRSLGFWDKVRSRLDKLAERYVSMLQDLDLGIGFAPNIRDRLVSSTFNIEVPGCSTQFDAALSRLGIQTKRWWRTGVHPMSAFSRFDAEPLDTTSVLARNVIGIPFFFDLSEREQDRVVNAIRECLR
ncbi:MAG: DegT/DnrJ/EryC1/StrS family aminotransferase [Hyphomonas sp.]|nr:DegT/DnrJ/EryC1/StrS family aminotransferase [Hyphomonas sp.]